MRKLLLLLTLVLSAAIGSASYAQLRTLPANAKRTTVGQQKFALPYVELGAKKLKLSPGAVIYDRENRTLVHNALPPGADVIFTTDMHGDVARIYILNAYEQAQLNQKKR
jgi:hypothetical protein